MEVNQRAYKEDLEELDQGRHKTFWRLLNKNQLAKLVYMKNGY